MHNPHFNPFICYASSVNNGSFEPMRQRLLKFGILQYIEIILSFIQHKKVKWIIFNSCYDSRTLCQIHFERIHCIFLVCNEYLLKSKIFFSRGRF